MKQENNTGYDAFKRLAESSKETPPTPTKEQYLEPVNKLYMDAGDYQRTKDADEIFIRLTKKQNYTESYDVCRFGCDETGEPLEIATEIVKRYNSHSPLAKALQDMIDEAKGAIFVFGNENNYPEGTQGYRIRTRLEGASENAKQVLKEAGLTNE